MIAVQVYTILFALLLALLNKRPVLNMVRNGATVSYSKTFHAINAGIKIVCAAVWALVKGDTVLHKVELFFLLLLIMWLVFDIALNLLVGNKPFYSGTTAFLDKLVTNGFVKAVVCFIIIIALNIFLKWQ